VKSRVFIRVSCNSGGWKRVEHESVITYAKPLLFLLQLQHHNSTSLSTVLKYLCNSHTPPTKSYDEHRRYKKAQWYADQRRTQREPEVYRISMDTVLFLESTVPFYSDNVDSNSSWEEDGIQSLESITYVFTKMMELSKYEHTDSFKY
jgi:hypothetical protein